MTDVAEIKGHRSVDKSVLPCMHKTKCLESGIRGIVGTANLGSRYAFFQEPAWSLQCFCDEGLDFFSRLQKQQ